MNSNLGRNVGENLRLPFSNYGIFYKVNWIEVKELFSEFAN